MSEARKVTIDEALENSEKYNVTDCAAIFFDVKDYAIQIPGSIYEALGKPPAAQMVFNYDSGMLIIAKELIVRSRGKVGRPCKHHGILDESNRVNDLFIVKPGTFKEMCRHLPSALPEESTQAIEASEDKTIYAKYSVPGKLIDGKIAAFDLKSGSSLSEESVTIVNRVDGYTVAPPELFKPFCAKKTEGEMHMRTYEKIETIYARDIEGTKKLMPSVYRNPTVEFLKDNTWIWTEKVDGTNIRVYWDGHSISFGGRTERASIPAPLVNKLNAYFGGEENAQLFEQQFGEKEVNEYRPSPTIEYVYANYDIAEAKRELDRISDLYARAQTALDVVNNRDTFDFEE